MYGITPGTCRFQPYPTARGAQHPASSKRVLLEASVTLWWKEGSILISNSMPPPVPHPIPSDTTLTPTTLPSIPPRYRCSGRCCQWEGVFVPVVPLKLMDVLDSPVPALVGVQAPFDPLEYAFDGVVVLDLDARRASVRLVDFVLVVLLVACCMLHANRQHL